MSYKTVTITDKVAAVTEKAILLEKFRAPFARSDNRWIPKSAIAETDSDLDELIVGEEITIEVYDWKAKSLGLTE